MVVTLSSAAMLVELNAFINAMSSAPVLLFRDVSGNPIAQCTLGNPPGVVVGLDDIVLLGLPEYATVFGSSTVPVGAQVGSADILSATGVPLLTGIGVFVPTNQIAITSSTVNPGGQLGVIGAAISLP